MARFTVPDQRQFNNLTYGQDADRIQKLGIVPGESPEGGMAIHVVLTREDIRGLIVKLMRNQRSAAVFVDGDHHSRSVGDDLSHAGFAEAFPDRVFSSAEALFSALEARLRREKEDPPLEDI